MIENHASFRVKTESLRIEQSRRTFRVEQSSKLGPGGRTAFSTRIFALRYLTVYAHRELAQLAISVGASLAFQTWCELAPRKLASAGYVWRKLGTYRSFPLRSRPKSGHADSSRVCPTGIIRSHLLQYIVRFVAPLFGAEQRIINPFGSQGSHSGRWICRPAKKS